MKTKVLSLVALFMLGAVSVFAGEKTDLDKIEMAIAKVGHDTSHHKASTEVYDELPGCCKYDRSDKKTEGSHEGHQH